MSIYIQPRRLGLLIVVPLATLSLVLAASRTHAQNTGAPVHPGITSGTNQAAMPMSGPPPVLVIDREDVKPGHMDTHGRLEARYARALARTSWAPHYIAAQSVSGMPEAWFFAGYDSLAAFQNTVEGAMKSARQQNAEFSQLDVREADELSSARRLIAFYRPELSLNAPANIAQDRYFSITTYHVRPGHEDEFIQGAQAVRAAYDKAGLDSVHYAVFEVRSGGVGNMYLVVRPMKQLAEFSPAGQDKALERALGQEGWTSLMRLASDSIMTSENQLFAFDPNMSNPLPQFAQIDPFWAKRETPAVATSGRMKPNAQKQQ
jgi:hypothetical protein